MTFNYQKHFKFLPNKIQLVNWSTWIKYHSNAPSLYWLSWVIETAGTLSNYKQLNQGSYGCPDLSHRRRGKVSLTSAEVTYSHSLPIPQLCIILSSSMLLSLEVLEYIKDRRLTQKRMPSMQLMEDCHLCCSETVQWFRYTGSTILL